MRYVQMSSSFVCYIHLTIRGPIYVSVPLVHGNGKLDRIETHLRSYYDKLKGAHVHKVVSTCKVLILCVTC